MKVDTEKLENIMRNLYDVISVTSVNITSNKLKRFKTHQYCPGGRRKVY